ncbi:MAG: hypothetical protein AB7T10_08215 [bacterium]
MLINSEEQSVSDSLNCATLGKISLSFVEDVSIMDEIAYVANAGGGLSLIDISNFTR